MTIQFLRKLETWTRSFAYSWASFNSGEEETALVRHIVAPSFYYEQDKSHFFFFFFFLSREAGRHNPLEEEFQVPLYRL